MSGPQTHPTSEKDTEPRRSAPFPCGFCGRGYLLPRPRSCCSRGREWDLKIEEARIAIGTAVKEAMK